MRLVLIATLLFMTANPALAQGGFGGHGYGWATNRSGGGGGGGGGAVNSVSPLSGSHITATPTTGSVVVGDDKTLLSSADALLMPKTCKSIAQLKNAAYSACPNTTFIGDSITTQGFPQIFANQLNRAGVICSPFGILYTGGVDVGPSAYSYGTGWTLAGGFGPTQGAGARATSSATGNLTFTHPSSGAFAPSNPNTYGVTVFYTCASTGASAVIECPATYNVGTLTPTAGTISSFTVNGNGPDFIIKPPTGTGDITIVGCAIVPGANGFNTYDHIPNVMLTTNNGKSGSTTANWISGFSSYVNQQANINVGGITNTDAGQTNTFFLELGVNDLTTGVSNATVKANLQTMITAIKSAGADCILITMPPSDPATYSGIFAKEQQYQADVIDLGRTNNCLVVDIFGRWVNYSTAVANGFMSAGEALHPTAAGQQDLAAALEEAYTRLCGVHQGPKYIDLQTGIGNLLDGGHITDLSIATTKIAAGSATNGQSLQFNFGAWGPSSTGNFTTITNSGARTYTGTPTVINGSAGTLSWVMPEQGSGYKKMVVVLSGYTAAGTTVINYPVAFTTAPSIFAGQSVSTVTGGTSTTSALTLPAMTTQTGTILVEGF